MMSKFGRNFRASAGFNSSFALKSCQLLMQFVKTCIIFRKQLFGRNLTCNKAYYCLIYIYWLICIWAMTFRFQLLYRDIGWVIKYIYGKKLASIYTHSTVKNIHILTYLKITFSRTVCEFVCEFQNKTSKFLYFFSEVIIFIMFWPLIWWVSLRRLKWSLIWTIS